MGYRVSWMILSYWLISFASITTPSSHPPTGLYHNSKGAARCCRQKTRVPRSLFVQNLRSKPA
jgi:hypothetical protein